MDKRQLPGDLTPDGSGNPSSTSTDASLADAEGEERRKALSGLAHQHMSTVASGDVETSMASSHPLGMPRLTNGVIQRGRHVARIGRARWWGIATVALTLGVVIGAILYAQRNDASTGHTNAAFHPIIPRLDGLDCPKDVAWSPNNAYIGIVGYQNACADDSPSSYTYVPGLVTIYDTHSGKLIEQIQPDNAIEHAQSIAPPLYATPAAGVQNPSAAVIDYMQFLWSPDSRQIALVFSVREWTSATSVTLIKGLFVSDSTGAHARVLTHIVTPKDPPILEWDIVAGEVIPLTSGTSSASISPSPSLAAYATTAPALRFQWQANGHLVPLEPLTATASNGASGATAPATSSPIGTPDGGKDFSIWQPGTANLRIQATEKEDIPGVYTWETQFAAWSPDGRYVATPIMVLAQVSPINMPKPAVATLTDLLLASAPAVPVRDAGLQAVYAQMPRDAFDPNAQSVSIAWRPDGIVLAAQPTNAAGNATTDNQAVTLYNCQSGKRVALLTPQMQSQFSMTESNDFLRWSPDGKRLLLLDDALGSVTIWAPGLAPSA